jgi:multidrug efflux pump subunit AcrA (membrane-fusion protein)
MKFYPLILLFCLANHLATAQVPAATPPSAPKLETTILDETGVKNLRIETVEAEETVFEETVFAFGRTEAVPQNRSELSSRISGRILENRITVGSFVGKGDKLILLESRQPGDPPPAIWLTAPADGTVLSVNAVVGSPIEPSNVLARFADLRTIYLIVTMPQEIAGKIRQGTEARVRFPIRPDKEYMAVLLKFATCPCPDPACALGQDTSTRSNEDDRNDRNSASVIFTLENPDNQLRPGMNSETSIILNKRPNVIGIPRAALQGEASKRFVYVRDFELPNAFIKTPVQVGQMNDRMVEIISGLLPADEVVTKGAYSLSFAGGGGVSLKEALDAAHGHEHAEDGGELTPEKRAEMEAKKRAVSGLPPESSVGGASRLWMYASGMLFLLLLASFFTKLRGNPSNEEAATPNPRKH